MDLATLGGPSVDIPILVNVSVIVAASVMGSSITILAALEQSLDLVFLQRISSALEISLGLVLRFSDFWRIWCHFIFKILILKRTQSTKASKRLCRLIGINIAKKTLNAKNCRALLICLIFFTRN